MRIFIKNYEPNVIQIIKGMEKVSQLDPKFKGSYQDEESAIFALGLDLDHEPGIVAIDSGVTWMSNMLKIPEKDRVQLACVWDTETTGLTGYIVSIALELVNIWTGEIIMSTYRLIDPKFKIEHGAEIVHKISQDMVTGKPTFDQYWDEFKPYFEQADIMVGQNLGFDIGVIERDLNRYDIIKPFYPPVFDTQTAVTKMIGAKNVKNKIKKPNLGELVEAMGIPEPEGEFHNAQVDVEMTRKVFLSLVDALRRTVQ